MNMLVQLQFWEIQSLFVPSVFCFTCGEKIWDTLRPITRIWNVTMLYLVKGSGKKAGRCQSYTNFFPEGLTDVCGAMELKSKTSWSLFPLGSESWSKYITNAA